MEKLLSRIEQKYNITIIYAAETGSREKGIESQDTGSIVQFVYAEKSLKPYVNLEARDLIEGDEYYQNCYWQGHNINSALYHVTQMSPFILELLYSSTVYRKDVNGTFVAPTRQLIEKHKRVAPLIFFYRSLARLLYHVNVNSYPELAIHEYMNVIRLAALVEWLTLRHVSRSGKNMKSQFLETNLNGVMKDLDGHMKADVHSAIIDLMRKKKTLDKGDQKVSPLRNVNKWIEEVIQERKFGRIKPFTDLPIQQEYQKILFSVLNLNNDSV